MFECGGCLYTKGCTPIYGSVVTTPSFALGGRDNREECLANTLHYTTLRYTTLHCCTGLSRLYLGVHSIPDLVGGTLLGVVVGVLASIYISDMRLWLIHHRHSSYAIFLMFLVIVLFHPKPPTVTFGRNLAVGCLIVGCCIAMKLHISAVEPTAHALKPYLAPLVEEQLSPFLLQLVGFLVLIVC